MPEPVHWIIDMAFHFVAGGNYYMSAVHNPRYSWVSTEENLW